MKAGSIPTNAGADRAAVLTRWALLGVLTALLGACATPGPASGADATTPTATPPDATSPEEPDAQPPGPAPPPQPDTGTATLALLQQSERAEQSGEVLEAIAYTDRAIRLSPRQADLWIRRAALALRDDKPADAIQYANKALSLTGSRVDWQRQAWLVIADAHERRGESEEAAEIRRRWRRYRG